MFSRWKEGATVLAVLALACVILAGIGAALVGVVQEVLGMPVGGLAVHLGAAAMVAVFGPLLVPHALGGRRPSRAP